MKYIFEGSARTKLQVGISVVLTLSYVHPDFKSVTSGTLIKLHTAWPIKLSNYAQIKSLVCAGAYCANFNYLYINIKNIMADIANTV